MELPKTLQSYIAVTKIFNNVNCRAAPEFIKEEEECYNVTMLHLLSLIYKQKYFSQIFQKNIFLYI